ncbi:hypothetical protein OAK85_02985 [Mariniblastus sp.]|jgi:hypothetical protein|nr:hypothetical protein [Mariniblastus sp.]MDC0284297.1 hypothetical protein [Mariniblastus sp.]
MPTGRLFLNSSIGEKTNQRFLLGKKAMLKSYNLIFGTMLAIFTSITLPLTAQTKTNVAADSLTAAKQISAASGRPIFAIAGQST